LAIIAAQGPGPDIVHFRSALDQARANIRIAAIAADAGYDSEATHEYCRAECGVRSLIPPRIGRPSAKPPRGYWRRQMYVHLKQSRYGQRWQVETIHPHYDQRYTFSRGGGPRYNRRFGVTGAGSLEPAA